MTTKTLLETRNKAKKVKPDFIVKEAKFSSGVKRRWRFPRGKHSSVRQIHKGRPALPHPGYGSPKAVKGLTPAGKQEVLFHTLKELAVLDPKTDGALIAGSLGNRKRLILLKAASEKKIPVLGVKDVAGTITQLESSFAERKKKREARLSQKDKKLSERKKKAEEKEKSKQKEKEQKAADSTESVEDKLIQEKDAEKKLAEKTITKKQ